MCKITNTVLIHDTSKKNVAYSYLINTIYTIDLPYLINMNNRCVLWNDVNTMTKLHLCPQDMGYYSHN